MTEEEIKRAAKEFADQTMKQRSDDHDEDTDEESISPVERAPKNETNETDGVESSGSALAPALGGTLERPTNT